MSYLVISPCRNEAAYMEKTLASMAAQTVRPTLWVIVDDGSTDETPNILARFAVRALTGLKSFNKPDRGFRAVGSGRDRSVLLMV